jgi:hypothetical protein
MFNIWEKTKILAVLQNHYEYSFGVNSFQMQILNTMIKAKSFKGLSPEESATRFMTVMINSINDTTSNAAKVFLENVKEVAWYYYDSHIITEDTWNTFESIYNAKINGDDSADINWVYDPGKIG